MSKKRIIGVAIVLALILLIGGMIAYFTDTDTETNVFTLGDNVNIDLVESAWASSAPLASGIHPGTTLAKNPLIHNESTTTPAYVFLEVVMPCYVDATDNNAQKPLFKLLDASDEEGVNSGWTLIKTTPKTTAQTISYVYAYGTASAMTSLAANASTPALFNKVELEPTLTATQKATTTNTGTNIVVNAYGIQTDNLNSTDPVTIFGNF